MTINILLSYYSVPENYMHHSYKGDFPVVDAVADKEITSN